MIKTDARPKRINWNLKMKRNQLDQSSRAAPSVPISAADVGTMMFVKPSPSWKARTATCLVTPAMSANGAINGIVRAACPDPDTTKKLKTDWNKNINHAEMTSGTPSNNCPAE